MKPKPTDAKKVLEMLYGAPKPAVSRLDMNFKDVTKRMPELQQAARLYEQGKITREQYYAIVDQLKPVTPYEFIPKPATAEEALAALSKDKAKDFGRTDVLTPGETILSRLDIPSYSQKGTWVTSQHRLKPPADEPKTIYTPTMMLEGETKMMPGTGAARRVAKGEKQKSSFATIRGAYKPGSDEEAVERAIEALRSKDYAQIGYDPERRGFFYDRRTMEPIIGTEEGIIQIGPLVLGKKPIRGNPEDFEYAGGGAISALSKIGQAAKAAKSAPKQVPSMAGLSAQERAANLAKFLEGSAVQDRLYHSTKAKPEPGSLGFSQFKTDKSEMGAHLGSIEQANQFGKKWGAGESYESGQRVMPVYASIKNPLRLDDRGQFDVPTVVDQLIEYGVMSPRTANKMFGGDYTTADDSGIKKLQEFLEKEGYDGIVYLNRREGFDPFGPNGVDGDTLNSMTDEQVMDWFPEAMDSVIAFKPGQIKSAIGNRGTFDPADPDITKAEGGAVHMQGGGSPLDQFAAKSRGVSSLPGYGEGAQDIQQALAAIQEGPVGRIASGVGELAEGYMSGAGSTDLQKIGQGLSMIPMLGLPATVSKTIKTARVGDAITDSLRAKYPNVDISVAGDNTLYLGKMVVPKEQRNQGIGTQVMNDLVKQADDIGATVTLSPSADFGGNKEKLKEFYKRFGFVQNTGKNKDFAISESMYRTPQENLPTNFSDLGAMATQAYADYKANPNQLNALRYQRIKKAADDAYVKTQATPSKPVVTDEDYRGLHTAPTRSSGAPLHALTQTYPDDIYSSMASQYYGHGEPRDAAVVSLAQSFKGRPHQMVTVYRAVPKNAKGGINAGDWVTIDRPYAKSHGESALRGDYKILSKRVRANEIFTNGDSIYEWGYDPVEAIKKAAGGAIHMQDGGDPTQMFNFNPMAAKAAKQKQMRESTPETPLGALSRGFASGLFGNIEDPVPYTGSIMEGSPQRQQSQANLREIGRNVGALTDIGGMVTPFAKPATQAITRGATALGRTGLEQVDRAMFGEGPLASLVAPVAPLQAVPRVQAPVSRLGFYDPVEQAGLNIQRKQGPGQAFLNELQRSENVSKDFLEASGIAEKLRTAPNITRDEVQAMTKGAVPEVEELVLGDIKGMALGKEQKIASQLVSSIDSSPRSHINLTGMQGPVFSDEALYYLQDGTVTPDQFPEGLQQLARDYINAHKTAQETKNIPTKWDRDDLILPGGSNYREVLLKVPSTRPSLKNMSREEYNRAIEEADRLGLKDYTHQHWGSTPNVVAHIRMNDRTDYNGNRVLFIEEIQSDWAQEGRKKGFADKPLTRDDLVATVNNSADRPYWEVRTKDGLFIANTGLGDKEISAQEAVDEALHLVKTRGDRRIPTGPFVRNTNEWVDLSLKNIIKRAVDEGYDRVAFINGKQSSDRYNMANYVENIQWDSNVSKFSFGKSGAEKTVVINMQDGNPIRLPITPDGKVQSGRGTPFDGKDLDEIIGKDAAKKIMAGEKGSLEGEGLSIGGKGMKDFYDKIVPDRLRKLIGKDKVKNIPGAVKNAVPDPYIKYYEGDNKFNVYDDRSGELLNYFDTLDEAETYIAKLEKTHPALPQLGFDITPEIREKFSKPIPYKKGGAVRISDNPDTMLLELMNAPKMQAGGAALKAFRDKLLAQYQRSLAKDPRFKQAPGEVTNLAGKSYAQWAAEQQYKHDLEDVLARLSGVPEKKMSIQDLPVGSRLVSIIGDRTQADKILRSVNETPLANEVILHGGPRFGQGKLAQGKEDFWASQGQAAQGVQNRIDAAAERAKGKPVIGVYTAMSAKDSDMYAKHFAESLIEQYPFTGMTGKQVDAFNKEFRKKYPQFAGVDNPEFVDQIMANTEMRKAFVNEHLKKKNIEKFNIPDGLATRHAITVPELRDVPTGLAGYSVGEMKPGMALEKGSYLEHPTYNTVIPGRYMGGLEIMHDYRDLFPEATQRMRQTLRNNPKFQGPGARDPESQMFGTFGFQGAEQEVTQKLIDELAAREELIKQLGILPYKKGGKVKKVKISNNPDAMQLELMRKKKHA